MANFPSTAGLNIELLRWPNEKWAQLIMLNVGSGW